MSTMIAGLMSFMIAFAIFLISLSLPNVVESNEVISLMFILFPFIFLILGIMFVIKK